MELAYAFVGNTCNIIFSFFEFHFFPTVTLLILITNSSSSQQEKKCFLAVKRRTFEEVF
jgi:hypothetical protein